MKAIEEAEKKRRQEEEEEAAKERIRKMKLEEEAKRREIEVRFSRLDLLLLFLLLPLLLKLPILLNLLSRLWRPSRYGWIPRRRRERGRLRRKESGMDFIFSTHCTCLVTQSFHLPG